MFSTLDTTLSSIDKSSLAQWKTQTGRSEPLAAFSASVKRLRSKTGCLICRARKKKCDETHPTCTYCEKRGLECEWEIKKYEVPGSNKGARGRVLKKKSVNSSECTILNLNTLQVPESRNELAIIPTLGSMLSPILSVVPFGSETSTSLISSSVPYVNTSNHLETPDFELSNFYILEQRLTPPMLVTLSSPFNLFLDDTGIFYLSYFEENVANLLSISPQSSNYFLKTFFTLSITSEAILNVLAAWGALFHPNSDLTLVNKYITKARIVVNENPTDKFDFFIALAYYLITIGIQVCAGDTRNWHQLFRRCEDLMRNYGGFLKFIKDFNYSNDCKFMIANFQFHDIMSSETLLRGTTCSMSNYNDLFRVNKLLETDGYGVDPYQGCIQPIYLLLGEIMNVYVELKAERKNLNEKLNVADNLEVFSTLNLFRLDHYKKIDEKYHELTNKINCCEPVQSQLDQLSSDEERESHLKLFQLYRITGKMYIAIYIKQTQPMSAEVQNYLVSALSLISDLINTNLISSLNMSLLICGISCCNKFDRLNLDSTFEKVYSHYHVGNVKRIWDVVKESWRRNSTGTACIDWIDICNDFGWKLSMC